MTTDSPNVLHNLIPGFLQGLVRTIIVYPSDAIKVHMQKHQHGTTLSTISHALKNDPKIFYRGSTLSFLITPIDRALQFYFLESAYKKNYNPYLIGLATGAVASLYTTPIQYILRNAILDKDGYKIYQNLKSGNLTIKKLYRHLPIEFPKISIGTSIQVGTYMTLRSKIPKERQVYYAPLIGGACAMLGWSVIFPLDRIMTEVISESNRNFASLIKKCAQRGIRGFYFGITPVFIRSIPATAAGMFVYEYSRKRLGLK
ncbi:MAG: hypothetical protein Hyperionvirus34_21 [Hyperionvirus sp.]|uniref:Mitochondrial carrier protein n=1 Tax=Hyperionvirus sp. TaxID=2487770 RepID=A0A3G5AC10_9VIRU|nr:MAG: hypothetical protein Hyperionvirus34_21 [Hyperionvirus sp.]